MSVRNFLLLTFLVTLSGLPELAVGQTKAMGDTTTYIHVSRFSHGDTNYAKVYFLNDTTIVRTDFFGHAFDLTSITPNPTDTFIVYKTQWRKITNGIRRPHFSVADFEHKKVTIEYQGGEDHAQFRYSYKPVKKIMAGEHEIFVYNLDVMRGPHLFYHDTRVYFSFQYGIVGYINLDNDWLLKQFKGKLEMELRPRED